MRVTFRRRLDTSNASGCVVSLNASWPAPMKMSRGPYESRPSPSRTKRIPVEAHRVFPSSSRPRRPEKGVTRARQNLRLSSLMSTNPSPKTARTAPRFAPSYVGGTIRRSRPPTKLFLEPNAPAPRTTPYVLQLKMNSRTTDSTLATTCRLKSSPVVIGTRSPKFRAATAFSEMRT